VLFVCTGNAVRSVIAGAVLRALAGDRGAEVRTAGTHALEGQPMGERTRQTLEVLGVPVVLHASHQVDADDLSWADLVVGMEQDHVRWVRATHPEAAAKTATLPFLAARLRPGPAPLAARVRALGLEAVDPALEPEIPDPGAGELEDYVRCAERIKSLVERLWAALDPVPSSHDRERPGVERASPPLGHLPGHMPAGRVLDADDRRSRPAEAEGPFGTASGPSVEGRLR
jgi:protein-tyrosine-phosphatase